MVYKVLGCEVSHIQAVFVEKEGGNMKIMEILVPCKTWFARQMEWAPRAGGGHKKIRQVFQHQMECLACYL
jgi:hypothetical protein